MQTHDRDNRTGYMSGLYQGAKDRLVYLLSVMEYGSYCMATGNDEDWIVPVNLQSRSV
jgi:hypothetical protein